MEVAALGVQQLMAQTNVGLSMVKQAAKSEQEIVNMVATSATRGQNLDIKV